jgi:hypothetical protein
MKGTTIIVPQEYKKERRQLEGMMVVCATENWTTEK